MSDRFVDDQVVKLATELAEAYKERDLLAGLIARAAAALAAIEYPQLSYDLGKIGASSSEAFGVTHRAARALVAVLAARAILREAEPADLEAPGDEGVGHG